MSINPCRHTARVLNHEDIQNGDPPGTTAGQMLDGGFPCSICYPTFGKTYHPSEVYPNYFDESGDWIGTKRITQDEHKNLAKVAWSIGIISFIIIMYILAAS